MSNKKKIDAAASVQGGTAPAKMTSDLSEVGGIWIGGHGTLVQTIDTTDITTSPDRPRQVISKGNTNYHFVRRFDGHSPYDVIRNVMRNITTASNLEFKCQVAYGEGLLVHLRKRNPETGEVELIEQTPEDQPEIFDWLEMNNYNNVLMETINDLRTFHDSFIEYIFSRDGKKIVQVKALETACSQITEIDEKKGYSLWHGYYHDWQRVEMDKVVITPLLSLNYPLFDLRQRMGLLPGEDGKKKTTTDRRFVHHIMLPSPGRFYYGHPYYWSAFKSGWFDFNNTIIDFKKNLVHNEMVVKHAVYIRRNFWDDLYTRRHVTDAKARKKLQDEYLDFIDKFLSGAENAGTTLVSEYQQDFAKGVAIKDIIIENLETGTKGGDYIEDSEESSNMLCYAQGVHSSILGNSPGKTKTINGTEARELFMIQQSLSKFIQTRALEPLTIVRWINGWNRNIVFSIGNLQLTTLDKNTGAVKNIGVPQLPGQSGNK